MLKSLDEWPAEVKVKAVHKTAIMAKLRKPNLLAKCFPCFV